MLHTIFNAKNKFVKGKPLNLIRKANKIKLISTQFVSSKVLLLPSSTQSKYKVV